MKYPQLTRRIFLAGGAAGVSLLRGASTRTQEPACTLVSEQEEGPYYLDGAILRRAISERKPGLPLRLRVSVSRDTHIHLKVHVNKHVCHTGQLFFPDDVSDAVAKLAPYRAHREHRTRLQEDHVFEDQHGSSCMVTLERRNRKSLEEGLVARIVLAVDPLAAPEPSFPGPPSGPEGPW